MNSRIVLTEDTPDNPIDTLAEIEIYKTQSVKDFDFCIGAVTRFNAISVACDNWAYSVIIRLKQATMQISTENSRIARDGRAGDQNRPSKLEITHSSSEKLKSSAGAGGKIGGQAGIGAGGVDIPSLKASFSIGGDVKKSIDTAESFKADSVIHSITALPGGRWLIADVISENLCGKYEPEEHLCKISVDLLKLSGSATSFLYFYPRDLSIEPVQTEGTVLKKLAKERPGNVSVAKALIAKHLRNLNPLEQSNLDGRIIIGTSKINYKLEETQDGKDNPRDTNRRKRRL